MSNLGYEISKSKFYKLCSLKEIPHNHFGRKLIFNPNDLIQWGETKTNNKKQSLIIKMNKYYGNR